MPGGFPFGNFANSQTLGAVTSGASSVTSLTAGAVNTKGAYTQLIASTTYDTCWMIVNLYCNESSALYGVAYDIAVGASGSEKVLINNLLISTQSNGTTNHYTAAVYSFPVQIPAGTRVAARAQCGTAAGANATTPLLDVYLFDGSFTLSEGAAGVDSLSFVSASTLGTAFTTGGSNAKGSYAQLIASTTRDYIGLFLGFDDQAGANASLILADLAIGASGSEQVFLSNLAPWLNTAGGFVIATPFIPIRIPSGSRLAIRGQEGTSHTYGCSAYGVYG